MSWEGLHKKWLENEQSVMRLIENCKLSDREALHQAVSLLQALCDLQNGPPTEKRKDAWDEVMDQSVTFLGDMDRRGIVPTEIRR